MKKQKHSIHPIFTHPFLYACMVTLLAGCPMPFQGPEITGKAPTSSSNHSPNQAKKLKPTTFPGAKIGTKQAVPSRDKQRGGAEAVRSQEVAGLGADGLKKHTAEFAALLNDRLEDQETEFTRLLAKLSESRATAGKNQETLPTEETNQIQITGGPENANPKSDENEEAIANNAAEIANNAAEIAEQQAEIAEQQAKIAEQQAKIAVEKAEIAADELKKLSSGMVLLLRINNQYAIKKAAAEIAAEAAEIAAEAVETARKAVEEAVAKAKSALQTAEEARTRLEAITKATNAAKAKAAEAVERARKSVERAENALTKASASSSTTKAAIEELRTCYYGNIFPFYGRTLAGAYVFNQKQQQGVATGEPGESPLEEVD